MSTTRWVEIMGGKFEVQPISDPGALQALCDRAYASNSADSAFADLRQVVGAVLNDWDEVVDRHGTPIPFTLDNATEIAIESPDLLIDILLAARTSGSEA